MEDVYFLNYDCIQNFSFERCHLTTHLIRITSSFFHQKCDQVTDLSIVRSLKRNNSDVLCYFKNLTSLKLIRECSNCAFVNFGCYIHQYRRKYDRFPPLKHLQIHGNMAGYCSLTNLLSFEMTNDQVYTPELQDLIKLTCLKFKPIFECKTLNDIRYLTNLKILKCISHEYMIHTITQSNFISLQKLSLSFMCFPWKSVISLDFVNLTYLRMNCGYYEEKYLLNLNNQTNLITLKLRKINFSDPDNYFRLNRNLTKLRLSGIDRDIELFYQYNYKLNHIEIVRMKDVRLNGFCGLKVKTLSENKSVIEN